MSSTSLNSQHFSLTHHSYFNLSGEGNGTIENHLIQIDSAEIVATDEKMSLLDSRVAVDATPADLREITRQGDAIPELWQQHGDLYWLGASGELRKVARVEDPGSGRFLEVLTDCSCLQTYFGAAFDGGASGKGGHPYERFAAFCLECEGYPQACGNAEFGGILVRPGEAERSTLSASRNDSSS